MPADTCFYIPDTCFYILYLAGFAPTWSRLEHGPDIPPLLSLPFLNPALRNADLFFVSKSGFGMKAIICQEATNFGRTSDFYWEKFRGIKRYGSIRVLKADSRIVVVTGSGLNRAFALEVINSNTVGE